MRSGIFKDGKYERRREIGGGGWVFARRRAMRNQPRGFLCRRRLPVYIQGGFRGARARGIRFPSCRQRHGATLLLDSMRGDAMQFTRRDEVEAEWRIITPIEEAWAQLPTPDFPNYAAGTEGPASWQELLEIRGNTAEHSGNESLQGQPAYTRSLSASPLSLHSCSRPEDSLPCPNA